MRKFLMLVAFCFLPMSSFAKGFGKFGLEDNLHIIQSVNYDFPEGKKYDLAYHTQTRYFIAGVYITKKGYALKHRGQNSYTPLDDNMISELQEAKLIPKPLPDFKISAIDYAFGYSLWIIIAVIAIWILIKTVFFRNKNKEE